LEALAAARARAAHQRHPHHFRLDRRDFDPVVAFEANCTAPETSAPQPWQRSARNSRRDVGFGCKGRCAPACGLAFGFGATGAEGFWPFEGGTLELSGVFGGRSSLASNSATRAVSAAFANASASTCFV